MLAERETSGWLRNLELLLMPQKPRKPQKTRKAATTVHARELSSLKMAGKNAELFPKVVDDGVVKNWVGIGWVSEGPEQSPRDDQLPRVVRD
jgi:hypothetical protein